jgi:thymidine kinase
LGLLCQGNGSARLCEQGSAAQKREGGEGAKTLALVGHPDLLTDDLLIVEPELEPENASSTSGRLGSLSVCVGPNARIGGPGGPPHVSALSPARMAKLYFYYAAMNAGKSTTLLQADFNYRERGMETMLWTAGLDDRAGAGVIGSRIALSAPAHMFFGDVDLFEAVAEERKRRPLHCILVDEAQFLTRAHVAQLCRLADELDLPVLCYGLRTDFRGELFEGSASLLALADALIELKAVCECGRKATMNLRVDAQGLAVAAGAQTEIGGNDRYVALCRRHFFERLREGEARQLSLGLPSA